VKFDDEGTPVVDLDRRALMQFALAIGGAGALGVTTAANADDGSLHEQIEGVLKETEAIWNSQEFHRLKEMWDADDPEPWYVPEEIQTPFRSWPEIERYWNPGRKVLDAFRWQFSNLHVKRLAPDLALALFDHFYEIKVAIGRPAPATAGFDRCIALFRLKPEGWRHLLYAQCPLGPDTYVRALRERIVSPDFEQFRESLQE
jgi:hypothetical protein